MESAAGGGSAERMWPGSAQCSNVQMSENTGVSEAAAAAGLMVYYPASPIISVIVQTVQLGIIIPWAMGQAGTRQRPTTIFAQLAILQGPLHIFRGSLYLCDIFYREAATFDF